MSDLSPPPTGAELREAALAYIARYASTEAGIRRILTRRIEKWRSGQSEVNTAVMTEIRTAIEDVIAALVSAGLVNDVEFAAAKGNSLRREGRSGRAVRTKLLAKGVPADLVHQALLDDPEAELAAAVMTARRRRLGVFGASDRAEAADLSRDLAKLLRAGFSLAVARRALEMAPEDAEALIRDARR
jgi:regulatory protein